MVLPFVPVIPTTCSCKLGSAKKRAAIGPMAARALGTISCGISSARRRSHTSAAAPAVTAAGAKSWPSLRKPGTQKKSAPGRTARLS